MRSLEKGKQNESLEQSIGRIAYAYGFTSSPANISKRALATASNGANAKTSASSALVNIAESGKGPIQTWGVSRKGSGTLVSFGIFSTRHAIAPAIVVKTALSISEVAGFSDLSVLVSSVGDAESRKRFTRELGNFFKKRNDAIPEDLKAIVPHDPDLAYRTMLERKDPVVEQMPRSIDYLSESSRKTMLATLSLFESVGIAYSIQSRLIAEPGVESELLFAIEGTDKKGERVRIATGGRYDEYAKRARGAHAEPAVAMSIEMQGRIDVESLEDEPACFIVHVGDAAKLRSFALLEALWRAHVAVGQALMTDNLRDQVEKGTASGTKYIAIIGQREALDNTAIVRSVATQVQTTIPLDKLGNYVTRGHRS
ncbi:MAG: His/Gly/Thr/Pro-type tRNA ligase C-terminal domain-containing protein [Patescibacteria group bacterium]